MIFMFAWRLRACLQSFKIFIIEGDKTMQGINSKGSGVHSSNPFSVTQVNRQNSASQVASSEPTTFDYSNCHNNNQELVKSIGTFVVNRCYGLNKKQIKDEVSGVCNLQISQSVMYKAIHDFLVAIFEKNNKYPLSLQQIDQAIDFAAKNFKASFTMAPNTNDVARKLADELKLFANKYKTAINDILNDKSLISIRKKMLLNKMLEMKCQASIMKIAKVVNANYKHISADTRIIRHALLRVFVSVQKENYTQKHLEQVEKFGEEIIKDKQTDGSCTKKDLDELIKVLECECSYEIFSLFKREAKFNGAAVAMNAEYFEPILKQFDNIEGYMEKFIRIQQEMQGVKSITTVVMVNSLLNLIKYFKSDLSGITNELTDQEIIDDLKNNNSTYGLSDAEFLSLCSNFRRYAERLSTYFATNKKKAITPGDLEAALNYKKNFNSSLLKKEVESFIPFYVFKKDKLNQDDLCEAIIMAILIDNSEKIEPIICTHFKCAKETKRYSDIITVYGKFSNLINARRELNKARKSLFASSKEKFQNIKRIYFYKNVTEDAANLFAEIKEIVKDFYLASEIRS